MFLSIVIPVYNVEIYLKKCIDSILECRLKDYELILVNDGSTDNSYDICLNYEKKYKEICVINQKNGGLSNARNSGLKEAKGRYVVFIDSDDYIISRNFSKLVEKLKNQKKIQSEIIISDFFRVSQDEKIIDRISQIEESEELICNSDYMTKFLAPYGCFWNTWRFVFDREFLQKNGFYFKDGFLCEDIDFGVKTLIKSKKIGFYHNPYYCYRIGRESSIMNIVNIKRVHDYLLITRECIELLKVHERIVFSARMRAKLGIEYILNLATIYEVDKIQRKEAKKLFMQSKYVLMLTDDRKCEQFNSLINIFGISAVAFVLFLLKKGRRTIKVWKRILQRN